MGFPLIIQPKGGGSGRCHYLLVPHNRKCLLTISPSLLHPNHPTVSNCSFSFFHKPRAWRGVKFGQPLGPLDGQSESKQFNDDSIERAGQRMNIYFASSRFLRAIFHQFPREKSGGSEKLCSLVRMNNYPPYSGQPARAGAGQFAVPFFSCSVSNYNWMNIYMDGFIGDPRWGKGVIWTALDRNNYARLIGTVSSVMRYFFIWNNYWGTGGEKIVAYLKYMKQNI